jgi:DNA-binding MarR family transcriptional regulator
LLSEAKLSEGGTTIMSDIPIGRIVSMIHRQNQKFLSKELKPYELGNGGQQAFLKTIIAKPGINQDELSSLLKFDKATTARAVKHLESVGYIERHTDDNDRRFNNLYPTTKAMNIFPEIQKVLERLNKEMTKNLTEEEEQQLLSLLMKIYPELMSNLVTTKKEKNVEKEGE